jgi:two-component system, sensor histidine kinase
MSAQAQPNTPGLAAVAARRTGIRIMLIEDYDDARELVHDILDCFGYDVAAAEDGAQARKQETRPDLILCDLSLPDCTGSELLESLRRRPGWEHVPAIAIGDGSGGEDLREAERAGFIRFLHKPVSVRELERVIRETVPGRR